MINKKNKKTKVVIIGAGPAGLAAAYEFLSQNKLKNYQIEIYESEDQVGGLSKTLEFDGFRFDLGGHRFYTKYPEIEKFYKNFLGKHMLTRNRLSRIYYGKKFYNYPLSASNALLNLGLPKSLKIFNSYLKRQFNKFDDEVTFDQWVCNRFGDELFKIFFKSYTEKVWGIQTSELSADWAAQRIQNFNLSKAIINAIFKINPAGSKTIINRFYYPKFGPGMLYEKLQKLLQKNGVKIHLNHEITNFDLKNNRINQLTIKTKKDRSFSVKVDYIISTMPFNKLIHLLKPPKKINDQIKKLQFRNFIAVNLIIGSNPFPDQWIYIHDPDVKVGRIQNFRNWSPYMVKTNSQNTPIGMEYFASENDQLWNLTDKELLSLAKNEISKIGLVKEEKIIDGFVYRVKNAYPVYNFDYQKPLKVAKNYLKFIENLYLCGRGGLFRYNNQDHSILSAFYTARNIITNSRNYDVWKINDDAQYLEEKK